MFSLGALAKCGTCLACKPNLLMDGLFENAIEYYWELIKLNVGTHHLGMGHRYNIALWKLEANVIPILFMKTLHRPSRIFTMYSEPINVVLQKPE